MKKYFFAVIIAILCVMFVSCNNSDKATSKGETPKSKEEEVKVKKEEPNGKTGSKLGVSTQYVRFDCDKLSSYKFDKSSSDIYNINPGDKKGFIGDSKIDSQAGDTIARTLDAFVKVDYNYDYKQHDAIMQSISKLTDNEYFNKAKAGYEDLKTHKAINSLVVCVIKEVDLYYIDETNDRFLAARVVADTTYQQTINGQTKQYTTKDEYIIDNNLKIAGDKELSRVEDKYSSSSKK